jgi:hypothetical protein
MVVDKEVVRAFLEDGGAVPESEGSYGPISDAPFVCGCCGHWHGQLFICHWPWNWQPHSGQIPVELMLSSFVFLINERAMVNGGWCKGLTNGWVVSENLKNGKDEG